MLGTLLGRCMWMVREDGKGKNDKKTGKCKKYEKAKDGKERSREMQDLRDGMMLL
jgi:hypothetical protein